MSGGGGGCDGSAGIGGNGRSILAAEDNGAGGGTFGGPDPTTGGCALSSVGDPAAELPDTELRDCVFVIPGRHTA